MENTKERSCKHGLDNSRSSCRHHYNSSVRLLDNQEFERKALKKQPRSAKYGCFSN